MTRRDTLLVASLLFASLALVLSWPMVAPSHEREDGGARREARCPRLYDLPRLCVPLPASDREVIEVGPREACPEGFWGAEDVEVRKLSADTILLKETGDPQGEKPVMVLFLGEGRALLLDAGNNSLAVEDVVAPLLGGRRVELLNTHLHGDHIGRNARFSVIALQTPEVLAHCGLTARDFDENHAALCRTTTPYTPPDDQTLFSSRSFRVARVIREGHALDLGAGRLLRVYATPGHSETSLTLYDTKHRWLFTGDSLYPGSNPPLVHPETGSSFASYLATAALYGGFEVEVVIGAHGEGLMPSRSLGGFFALVRARFEDPEGSADFIDDAAQCPAGDFVMGNDPTRP